MFRSALILLGLVAGLTSSSTPSPTYIGPPPCSPAPLALGNGDFQTGSLAPWKLKSAPGDETLTNYTVERLPVPATRYALRIDEYVRYSEYGQPHIQQANLPVCQAYQYRVSYDYKILRAYPTAILQVGPFRSPPGRPLTFVTAPANATTGGWMHRSALVNVTLVPAVNFEVALFSQHQPPHDTPGASALVANVAMAPVASLVDPACPHAPAPLANAAFQTGQVAPWSVLNPDAVASWAVVANASGQAHALRVSIDGGTPSGAQVLLVHPLRGACLGFMYVLQLTYNVVEPFDPRTGPNDDVWRLVMPGCRALNSSLAYVGSLTGPAALDQVGVKTIGGLCRMAHGGELPVTFTLLLPPSPSGGGQIDVLNMTARLATTEDIGAV